MGRGTDAVANMDINTVMGKSVSPTVLTGKKLFGLTEPYEVSDRMSDRSMPIFV